MHYGSGMNVASRNPVPSESHIAQISPEVETKKEAIDVQIFIYKEHIACPF